MSTIVIEPDRARLAPADHDTGVPSGAVESGRRPGASASALNRAGAVAVALALAGWAFAPLVITALAASAQHRVFLGVSGYFPWDGLQYLAYTRDGPSGLIPNLYGLTGASVFVHPVWSLTGIVQGVAGIGPVVIMVFWKLVSAGVLFGGVSWIVARYIPADQPGRRAAALALCLFGGFTPLVVLMLGSDKVDLLGTAVDLVPAATLWDYAPIALAIGLMPFAVEHITQIVHGSSSPRATGLTAGCCLLIGWLHPWQGATLTLVLVLLVIWRCGDARDRPRLAIQRALRGRARALAMVLGAALTPLAYYALLSTLDASWSSFSARDAAILQLSLPSLAWCVTPLTVLTGGLLLRCHRDPRVRGLLAWSVATLVLLALRPPEQYHSLDGLVIPLALLAVRCWPAGGRRTLAWAALAAVSLSFAGYAVLSLARLSSPDLRPYLAIAPSDAAAVAAAGRVAGRTPILTTRELGNAVPMLVDRATWLGNQFWTPDFEQRQASVDRLFSGTLSAAATRAIVTAAGARTLIEPCGYTVELEPALRSLGFRERSIGCARLYLQPVMRPRTAGSRLAVA